MSLVVVVPIAGGGADCVTTCQLFCAPCKDIEMEPESRGTCSAASHQVASTCRLRRAAPVCAALHMLFESTNVLLVGYGRGLTRQYQQQWPELKDTPLMLAVGDGAAANGKCFHCDEASD